METADRESSRGVLAGLGAASLAWVFVLVTIGLERTPECEAEPHHVLRAALLVLAMVAALAAIAIGFAGWLRRRARGLPRQAALAVMLVGVATFFVMPVLYIVGLFVMRVVVDGC